MTHRALLSLAASLCLGLFSLPSNAVAPAYTVRDLGQGVEGTGLNAAGQVVGNFNDGTGFERAFITGAHGAGMTVLGTLGGMYSYATGVNSAGQVVGWSFTTNDARYGPRHAFITGHNGTGMRDLGTLGGIDALWGELSIATDINDAGQVAGWSYTPVAPVGSAPRVFVTGADGVGMQAFDVGGHYTYGAVINNAGHLAGSYNQNGYDIGFISIPNAGGVRDLAPGTLLKGPTIGGINEAGQVVGDYWFPGALWARAFITGPDGVGMTEIGTLGGLKSTGLDINGLGEVVGEAYTADGARHAFVTDPGGTSMVDLNHFVTLPGGADLYAAVAINDRGQILANSGNGHAYLLTPVPEPATCALMLVGLAAVVSKARRHRQPEPT